MMYLALIGVKYSIKMVLEIDQHVYHFHMTEIAPDITAIARSLRFHNYSTTHRSLQLRLRMKRTERRICDN